MKSRPESNFWSIFVLKQFFKIFFVEFSSMKIIWISLFSKYINKKIPRKSVAEALNFLQRAKKPNIVCSAHKENSFVRNFFD